MRLLGLTISLALTLAASLARAEPPSPRDKAAAQQEYTAGQAKYEAGDFLGAAEQFAAAYQHDPDPVYLFNLAQAYRFAKRCRDSADNYRRFLAAAPDAPNRDNVEHYLEEVDACARTEPVAEPGTTAPAAGAAPAPTAPGSPDQPGPPHHPPATAPGEPPPSAGVEAEAPAPGGHALRATGLALGVAGLAGVAAGAYFTWDVSHITDQRDHTCRNNGCDGLQLRNFDDRGTSAEHRAIAAYALGGAALAAGIILLVHEHHAHHALAFVPTRGGAMATAALRF